MIESRRPPEPSWRPGTARLRKRLEIGIYLLLALTLAGVGARAVIEDVRDQAEASKIGLEVQAFVPFGGGPGGWRGLVEIRNVGPRPVSVLGLDLPRPAVLLALHDVPLRIEVGSTRRLTMRLRLDCTARVAMARLGVPAIDVRARTADGRERTRRVAVADKATLESQLDHEQCGGPAGPTSRRLGVTYGSSDLRRGAIETTMLVRNDEDGPVKVLAVTGSSGWPGSARTQPDPLPAIVTPGRAIQLRLKWDVSACPRMGADDVISSLRMVLISPADTLQFATVDLGADFARDFFRFYNRSCR
jgi:hypothetical protein